MDQAIADAGLDANDISNERTGLIVGSGPVDARWSKPPIRPVQGSEARRAVRRAESHVLDGVGDTLHLVQDQGHELFDLVGLRDVEPLHRQRR